MLRDKSKSETRWFALDQVIVTRNVCMQGDRWWSLDMTGSDASIRRAHCDSDKLPLLICRQTGQTFASNSTVKSNIPTGVLPFSKSHGDGLVEEEPYKRCRAAYAEGMPCTLTKTCRENRKKHKPSYIRHQHAEFFPRQDLSSQSLPQSVTWQESPLLLVSDKLDNVGHAIRDMMFLNAFSLRWREHNRSSVLHYAMYTHGTKQVLPWVREFSGAIANYHNLVPFAAHSDETYCFRSVVQKASVMPGDAGTVRVLRDAAYKECQVSLSARADAVVHLVHGSSSIGDRALRNHVVFEGELKAVSAQMGLAFFSADLSKLAFCDQVALIARAKYLVGVLGAAVAAHFPITRDEAITIELNACKFSKGRGAAVTNYGFRNSFAKHAYTQAKGYFVFCLCVGSDQTDLYAHFANSSHGWITSKELYVDTEAVGKLLRGFEAADYARATSAAHSVTCTEHKQQGRSWQNHI